MDSLEVADLKAALKLSSQNREVLFTLHKRTPPPPTNNFRKCNHCCGKHVCVRVVLEFVDASEFEPISLQTKKILFEKKEGDFLFRRRSVELQQFSSSKWTWTGQVSLLIGNSVKQ